MDQIRTYRRKLRSETRIEAEPGFPRIGSMHYLPWLARYHESSKPKVYFEIGTESGASLAFATCVSIAVDPVFRLEADVSRNKPELHLFQGTSDDFFSARLLDRLGLTIDLAFLDGMHLFEFLLRDFINTEAHMSPAGTILIHDCVPVSRAMTDRNWDRSRTAQWTGDVWKLIPILREYRPDLTVETLDLAPTGLVSVRGLDPASTVLPKHYEEIVERYGKIEIDSFGLDRFKAALDLVCVVPEGARPATPFVALPNEQRIERAAIRTSIPTADVAETWGDLWFARGLKSAFEATGLPTSIDIMSDWADDHGGRCLNIFLIGHDMFRPPRGQYCFGWYIYPGKRYVETELAEYDHLFVASEPQARRLRRITGRKTISFLPQAFDPDLFAPRSVDVAGQGLVFVAKAHFDRSRGIALLALSSNESLRIWGDLWREPFTEHVVAPHIPNEEVAGIYRSALAVLCDHHPKMRRRGFVSNRIFDALACGVPVISDAVAGLPADFAPFVAMVSNESEFAAALAAIRAETHEDRSRRARFALEMARSHSFAARVDHILNIARKRGLQVAVPVPQQEE